MRIQGASLGLFVPASYTVPENPIAGLAGLAEFVDAHFVVPQNPIAGLAGIDEFVPAHFTIPEMPILLSAAPDGLGALADFVGTGPMYPIQLNSVLSEANRLGMSGLDGDCGCGCGGAGSCGGHGLGGITDDAMAWLKGQWSLIQSGDMMTIALWGAGALVLMYLVFGRYGASGSGYRQARAKALARLREEYPSVAGRARRAYRSF